MLCSVKLWLVVATALALGSATTRAQGRVQGTVYDSVAARPLDSAFVQLAFIADPSVSRSTITDARGRFALDSLKPGAWVVSLLHPRIDSAGVTQLVRRIEVLPSGSTRVQMPLPSAASITRRACGDAVARDSSGFVHGLLTDARRERVPVQGKVILEWIDAVLTVEKGARNVGYTRTPIAMEASSDSSGRFVACGVPLSGTIRMRGITADDSTGVVELQVPSTGIAKLDLSVGPSRIVAITPAQRDSTLSARRVVSDSIMTDSIVGQMLVRRGDGRLVGSVRMRNGAPLPNALVTVPGTAVETRTDSTGTFRLTELPSGTYTLEARAVGFIPSRGVVDILSDSPTDQLLVLDRLISLDTVMVRASRGAPFDPRMVSFEKRRLSGVGRYKGPQQLAEIRPFRVADILRTMSGIRIIYEGGRELVRMRTIQSFCTPEVFVDGMRMFSDDGDLDRFLYAEDIRAVEVYSPMLPIPPEFTVVGQYCGVIAFLTGSRK
jgi:hypothetical protein